MSEDRGLIEDHVVGPAARCQCLLCQMHRLQYSFYHQGRPSRRPALRLNCPQCLVNPTLYRTVLYHIIQFKESNIPSLPEECRV